MSWAPATVDAGQLTVLAETGPDGFALHSLGREGLPSGRQPRKHHATAPTRRVGHRGRGLPAVVHADEAARHSGGAHLHDSSSCLLRRAGVVQPRTSGPAALAVQGVYPPDEPYRVGADPVWEVRWTVSPGMSADGEMRSYRWAGTEPCGQVRRYGHGSAGPSLPQQRRLSCPARQAPVDALGIGSDGAVRNGGPGGFVLSERPGRRLAGARGVSPAPIGPAAEPILLSFGGYRPRPS